ncbi:SDR family NAD(P)-dependent oxidoreductase [Bacillus sp. FJAT-49705]|uniref:SDR family NAD(P)-dependent oxidoreductase n=1 Tax=Cytobacillus citreus TaxID=2833586 RepID=A0ABS5NXF9_9BACI|nr:SDR family NAD(P)-dependent oxidoreductase [Cytobacillus citreus]MBS4192487.1 SDR family NAD(P)-dependent oxidoreductase [Cytobacillus citreus]
MKSIIITGAGSGLGKELASSFGLKGYHIILTGRTMQKLKSVEKQIVANNGHADSFLVDITNQSAIKQFIDEANSKFDLFGLINNAGIGHFGPFEQLTKQEIEEMLLTNVFGTINMSQSFLSSIKNNKEGLIMNIISTAGLKGKANEAGYCASKFAVRGLTESMQKEYENSGMQIKAVYMGGMDTPFWDQNDHIQDKSRLRSPAEIATIILENMDQETIIIESKGK